MRRVFTLLMAIFLFVGCRATHPNQQIPDEWCIDVIPGQLYWPVTPEPCAITFEKTVSTKPARTYTGTVQANSIRSQEVHGINPTRLAAALVTAAEKSGFSVNEKQQPLIEASRVTITLAPKTIEGITYMHRLICTFNLDSDTVTIDVSSLAYTMIGGRQTDVELTDRVPNDVFQSILKSLGKTK